MPDSHSIDFQRRFGGLERLFGSSGLERLRGGHVLVAGIGGVGSWCAEALARSGVGAITVVDLDHIAESNVNRQLHALTDTLGQAKVVAMAQRIRGINPGCRLNMVDDFISPENVSELLPPDCSVIIDCTDQAAAKVAMILEAHKRNLPIVVCGGAGGKINPLALRAGDLSTASNDALLSKLRNTLRRRHGYARAADSAGKVRKRVPKMGVRVLWFDQPALLPDAWLVGTDISVLAKGLETGELTAKAPDAAALQGLSCAGYGSAVTVTAPMGMAAANEAIQWLISGRFSG